MYRPVDPALLSWKHRVHNREHWKSLRLPCARCGCAIDYDGPQYFPNGQQNLRYLVVGHVVGRVEARQLGWSEAEINDLSNTQPECANCSSVSGARDRQNQRVKPAPIAAPEASRW
jgi:hypothetical protein